MRLAYLFWHWPAPGVATEDYEARLLAFHAALGIAGSRTLRLTRVPFDDARPRPYEDWYPVDDWSGLGRLAERAVSGARRDPHDAAAERSVAGAGGVFACVRAGAREAAAQAAWLAKPHGMAYGAFRDALARAAPGAEVWQRQLVLGPAPEFAVIGAPLALPWPAVRTDPAALG